MGSKFYDDLGPQNFMLLLASRSQEMVDPTKSISLTSQQSKSLAEQKSLENNDPTHIQVFDHDELLKFGEVGSVGSVLRHALVVDVGQEPRKLQVVTGVQSVVPVLRKKPCFKKAQWIKLTP